MTGVIWYRPRAQAFMAINMVAGGFGSLPAFARYVPDHTDCQRMSYAEGASPGVLFTVGLVPFLSLL